MYYGDDIIVSKTGLRIRPKALEPIGIQDGSVCWGIDILPSNNNCNTQKPHLLISPFHPNSWHVLFRVTIGLNNDRGMLAKLTKVISDKETGLNINILFSQSAPSGHNHATFYLIGEAVGKNYVFDQDINQIIDSYYEKINKYYHKNEIKIFIENPEKLETDIRKEKASEFTADIETLFKESVKEIIEYRIKHPSYKTFKKEVKRYISKNLTSFTNGLDENSVREIKHNLFEHLYKEIKKLLANTPFEEFSKEIQTKISENLFKFSREIEYKINKYDDGYLHEDFYHGNTLLYEGNDFALDAKDFDLYGKEDFLFDSNDPNKSAKHFKWFYEPEKTEAVKSRWLQQMAIFSIYNRLNGKLDKGNKNKPLISLDNPISFKYDSKNAILKPISKFDKEKYEKIIEAASLEDDIPITSIAAFNPDEGYLRIVLPEKLKRIFIEIEYTTKIQDEEFLVSDESSNNSENSAENNDLTSDDSDSKTLENKVKPQKRKGSTKGLMSEIAQKIKEDEITINSVKNSLISYDKGSEIGKISFIGTPDKGTKENIEQVTKRIESQLSRIDEFRENTTLVTKIGNVGAKRIFISTKFDFAFERKPKFKDALIDLVKEYGFHTVLGDPQLSSDISDRTENPDLEDAVTERIKSSDAFLQIIPRILFEEAETNQDWLLFELGVARGAQIPCAICVDITRINEYPTKVGAKWAKFGFNSYYDTEEILEEIRKALAHLARKTYDR